MGKKVRLNIAAAPEQVFEKLCDAHFVAKHLHQSFKVELISTNNRGPGAEWRQYSGQPDDPNIGVHKIVESIPNQLVVMTSIDQTSSETFTLTLQPQGDSTVVTFEVKVKGDGVLVALLSSLGSFFIKRLMIADLRRFGAAVAKN